MNLFTGMVGSFVSGAISSGLNRGNVSQCQETEKKTNDVFCKVVNQPKPRGPGITIEIDVFPPGVPIGPQKGEICKMK